MNKNLQIAIEASLEAGKVIMEVYDTAFDIEMKEDKSPLTEADKKANDIINSFLIPTNIPIISEENKLTEFAIRKNWRTCWVVDPVDGTKEFINRNGEFTVNIALITNGKPEMGIIYVPATKILYYADNIENKAYKVELEDHSTYIKDVIDNAILLKPIEEESKNIKVVGSRSHMSQETLDFVETLKEGDNHIEIVSKGSSLKFCLVAEGNANIYPRFAPTMEWDTAAGQSICNAVGVDVLSKETNQSLLYNKESLINPWFIVSKS